MVAVGFVVEIDPVAVVSLSEFVLVIAIFVVAVFEEIDTD